MGLAGEVSSMVLSRGGQKMISGHEKYNSDSNSELFKLDKVDCTYKPFDSAQVNKIYHVVEPSCLISKQLTTSIYLVRTRQNTVSAKFQFFITFIHLILHVANYNFLPAFTASYPKDNRKG